MSYSMQFDVKDNVITIIGQTAEVPDGRYTVNGHDDATTRNINVTRYAEPPATEMVIQAFAWARRNDLPVPAAPAGG